MNALSSARSARLVGLIILFALALPACAQPRVVTSLLEIRRAHVVIQHWDLSCGAAALATLLRYQYGVPVSERQVALALMNRPVYLKHPELVRIRQGFSLLDLKRYADSHGYLGVAYGGLELKDLLKMAPAMVPINMLGYNHFVIFRGRLGNRVLLADPAWGNRTLLVQDFLDAWINFPQLGHVAFMVKERDGQQGPMGALAPRIRDFAMFEP
ncbi:MAG: C39 family peptidase [Betaproteobacteria bacterium]|nr:C39 family peptidase [Betaproteobacteria bacterium]